ncbi:MULTISPECIES: hypothetical protein [unclassified Agrococcus]|uniref:hypothetical protein n=1 Tax=unclassified Agrococcus TaxID=2615065 RepID=UPI00361ABE77
MQRIVAVILAILVLFLGVAGLSVEDGRLLGLNVDTPLDVLRLVLGTTLLIAGLVLRSASRISLVLTGLLYLAMGAYAVIDPSFGGVLPTGFDGLDVGFHLVAGALALVVGLLRLGPSEPSMDTEHRAGQSHDRSIGR